MEWRVDTGDRASVAQVQAELAELLRCCGADSAALADAGLVFAELIGNVVRHAPGPAVVSLGWAHGAPLLAVQDCGAGFTYEPGPAPDIWAEGGRGLFLVAALAEDVRVRPAPGGGARVEVRLFLPDDVRVGEPAGWG